MPAASRLPEIPAHRTFDRATVRLLLHARRGLAVAVGLALLRLGASRVVAADAGRHGPAAPD